MVEEGKARGAMVRSLIWPGWGHLYAGRRKKGWALFFLALLGLILLGGGIQLWLFPKGAVVKEEEVAISDEGIIIEEPGEVEKEEGVTSTIPLPSPLSISFLGGGLILLLATAIYGIKDTRRMVNKPEEKRK